MAKTALVVDDSLTELQHIKGILMEAGCIVHTARSGQEAVAKARAEKPAIIFLDIVMPGMDGYEACRTIAGDPTTSDIPIVFVTSKGATADKAWGRMQGAVGHVVKPFDADQIIDHLKKVG